MSEPSHGPVEGPPTNPAVRDEHGDVYPRGVVWFAVILASITLLAMLGLVGMFRLFRGECARQDESHYPVAVPSELPQATIGMRQYGNLPAEPRLEGIDMAQYRALRPSHTDVDGQLGPEPPGPSHELGRHGPPTTMVQNQAEEEKELNSYGKSKVPGRTEEVVHIPIEQAMKLLLVQQAVTKPETSRERPDRPAPGTSGGSSSGRTAGETKR